MPEPYSFDLRVQDEHERPHTVQHAALLPHEVFHSMYKFGRPIFNSIFVGGEGELASWQPGLEAIVFWHSVLIGAGERVGGHLRQWFQG